jgi:hypothetical protein
MWPAIDPVPCVLETLPRERSMEGVVGGRVKVHCWRGGPINRTLIVMSKRVEPVRRPGARHRHGPTCTRPGTVSNGLVPARPDTPAMPCLDRMCGISC